MRKIIQITAMSGSLFTESVLFALCDDGTLWQLTFLDKKWIWQKHIDIPQDEEKTPRTFGP